MESDISTIEAVHFHSARLHYSIFTHTHTYVALAQSYLIVSLAGQILLVGKAEKGDVTCPRMTKYREIPNWRV